MTTTILIAEDDKALAAMLARAVEAEGYASAQAHDGLSALQMVRDLMPDLVVVDLLLPKRDGRAVIADLQKTEVTRDIPAIAISGVFRGRAHARELQEAGAQAFLEKPFSMTDLIAHVQTLVGPAQGADAGPESGMIDLAETPAAEVLWSAISSGFSGVAQFRCEKIHKVVLFERGVPTQVRSNWTRECLGRMLLAQGRIDKSALEQSLQKTRSGSTRQGEVLVEIGALSEPEVVQALEDQVREKLLELFAWERGEAWLQEDVHSISYASPIEGWTGEQMLLAGVQRMNNLKVMERLGACSDKAVEAKRGPDDGDIEPTLAALEAIGDGRPLVDLVEVHANALYGMWLVGVAVCEDVAPPVGHFTPTKADTPGSGADAGGVDEKLAKLQELRAEMSGQDHFELLGIEHDASAGDIRR